MLRHYWTTWGPFDLLGALPLAPPLLLAGASPSSPELCAVRLLKLLRVAKLIATVHEVRDSRFVRRALREVDPAIVLLVELVVQLGLVPPRLLVLGHPEPLGLGRHLGALLLHLEL